MPTTHIPTDASPEQAVKHERCNVVLWVRGGKMTKVQAQLYGMQTQQGVLFRDILVVKKKMRVNVSFLPG